ncbi:hypothetical protein K435DRAFT_117888 [Dendrothele bispora CBS 962.96]|uniref:Zn(2)-C6 fungal-type domain-containing protein n=1 Tax=Dendrothele bispora (strain CBS 962.96) TaxID=1314807 RepID=A0A4S8MRK5_DENBC|nr:hypothetical protein K435DRAFT_117888 [Dendrothele bispora CBS 962.96]
MSQQGLVLPTPSMQNQMHELAKTLPPPRKQNTACDACRARKVKCQRLPGQEKCQHCTSKNYPCTHFVQQATSEKKRNSATSRRPRAGSSASNGTPVSPLAENGNQIPPYLATHLPLPVQYGFYPQITLSTPTREVLSYLFSPPESEIVDPNPFSPRMKSPYAAWGEFAMKLEHDVFRSEFALDLVEIYFQIVHSRLPLLDPAQFRNRLRLHLSSTPPSEEPLHPALVATVIAWGTKFSEHPLLKADRNCHKGQSLLSKMIIDRTRDLAEALKVHRLPTHDHVVIGLLIEPLQSQVPNDPSAFHCFWLTAATRHLLDLQINHKSVTSTISDPEARGTMIFAWWMTCICDAFSSVYYRRKPILDDDDYDIDFYTAADPVNVAGAPSPREQLEFLGYYRAAHSLARTARQMSRQLWRPITDSDGIPLQYLRRFGTDLRTWRDKYLARVGVPKTYDGWDFVTTVSCFASDAQYHVMWIVLFTAMDDFGIKELNEAERMGTPPGGNSGGIPIVDNRHYLDEVARKIGEEAVNGALRIAALVSVLTSNEYLKLDPAVMEYSCIAAGQLLAKMGRPEVSSCISGLEQYSHSYEEAGDAAHDIRKIYETVRTTGNTELTHMGAYAKHIPSMPTVTSDPIPPEHFNVDVDGDQVMGKSEPSSPF